MRYCYTICFFLLASVTANVLEAFDAEEPEMEAGLDHYKCAVGILCTWAMPAEIRAMILDKLTILEYADYLLCQPRTAQTFCLSDEKERTLLLWAHLRLQELHDENRDESIVIERLRQAVMVIARKMGFSVVEYEQASAEEQPLIAAQGMEQAVMKLSEISTKPFWLRLGIMAFIELDDFPAIHRHLSTQFKRKHDRHMLRAAALSGNMVALTYLAPPLVGWRPKKLLKLMKYSCQGGHIEVFEWVLSKNRTFKHPMAYKMFKVAITAGHLKLLEYLLAKDSELSNGLYLRLALLAIEKGKLEILEYFVNSVSGSDFIVNRVPLTHRICTAAVNGNDKMVQYLLELEQRAALSYRMVKEALHHAVDFGSLEVLEYLLGISGVVDGLHKEFPDLMSKLYLQAAWRGHLHILRFLLADNADGTAQFPHLDPAFQWRYLEIVSSCLPEYHFDSSNYNALMIAARWGHVKIVQYLLMLKGLGKERLRQLDPTAGNHFALDQAIRFKHQSIVNILFGFVDAKSDSSQISVTCAYSGNVRIMKGLTKIGLLTAVSSELTRIMEKACYYGHLGVVKYIVEDLLKFQIEPIAGDFQEYLMNAIESGHAHIVEYLLQQKADDSFLFHTIDLASCCSQLFGLAVIKCQVRIINFLLDIARNHIDLRVVDAIHSSNYMNHYPTARIVIREMYGPCPFVPGSYREKYWVLWKAREHDLLAPSQPSRWNRRPRTTDQGWMRLAQVVANPKCILPLILSAIFMG